MSVAVHASRTHVWLEGLGEWSWPGRAAASEVHPPVWVPQLPPDPRSAAALQPQGEAWRRQVLRRRLGAGAVLSALAAVCVATTINGTASVGRLLGIDRAQFAGRGDAVAVSAQAPGLQPLPKLATRSRDAAGSAIGVAHYKSVALHGEGSFLVYLPAHYQSSARRFPVLYLLHGTGQPASAFLGLGLQGELDRLIGHRSVAPLIAVMIQGGPGPNNWRDTGVRHYESYVLEVQELIDRMLPTAAARSGRAIAGFSMGGYGAMRVALENPYRFAVVESWLGFFNGLDRMLGIDRHAFTRAPLAAFLYGAESDHITDPNQNPTFAGQLRSAGARAHSAIYPGGHSMETLQSHLAEMLAFAGRTLSAGA
ncbi:MAG: putative tributyrin esterase [Solirubrobacteraceae bacterium]|nr:putative tributyrin esterase [Solirubrobacteraceae bacterium]